MDFWKEIEERGSGLGWWCKEFNDAGWELLGDL